MADKKMDDIVAVRYRQGNEEHAIITWGRTFAAVDPEPLLNALRPILTKKSGVARELRVCASLREVRDFEFFYEALLHFAVECARIDLDDAAWNEAQRSPEQLRRAVYRLGRYLGGPT